MLEVHFIDQIYIIFPRAEVETIQLRDFYILAVAFMELSVYYVTLRYVFTHPSVNGG